MNCFSCASRILTLAFVSLMLMRLSLSLSYLEFLKLIDVWIYSFYQIWGVWVIICLSILSAPSLSPPSETSVMCILAHLMMPHQLCSFFIILSFFLLLKLDNLNWLSAAQLSSVQSLSRVRPFATPWTAARQASLSIASSWGLSKLMSIESVMPSNHLILCRPLLLLPSIFPSIRVFSNESALHIRGPKYWSFSFNISPSNDYTQDYWVLLCLLWSTVELFWRTFHFIFL